MLLPMNTRVHALAAAAVDRSAMSWMTDVVVDVVDGDARETAAVHGALACTHTHTHKKKERGDGAL